jgi:hypothetical protein
MDVSPRRRMPQRWHLRKQVQMSEPSIGEFRGGRAPIGTDSNVGRAAPRDRHRHPARVIHLLGRAFVTHSNWARFTHSSGRSRCPMLSGWRWPVPHRA